MDTERAAELAEAWRQQCSYDPDTAGHTWSARSGTLELLLTDAIPDPDTWAIYNPPASVEAGVSPLTEDIPAVALIAQDALYRVKLEPATTRESHAFGAYRDELAALNVTLVERLEDDIGGERLRARGWVMTPQHGDVFGFLTAEALDGPNARTPPIEHVARAVARGAGWQHL